MSQVFVSYSHTDEAFVRLLLSDIEDLGVSVWIDLKLDIGDSLILRISDAIQASDFLIACLSKTSVKSNWVKKELAVATTMGINGNRVFVLPLLLAGIEQSDIPLFLADLLCADFREPASYDRAFNRLIRRIQSEAIGKDSEGEHFRPPTVLRLGLRRVYRLVDTARNPAMNDWVVSYLATGLQGPARRPDPTERYWSYIALGKIRGDIAKSLITEGLDDENEWARKGAREAWREP